MKIEVKAGNHDRVWVPVHVEIPTSIAEPISALRDSTTGIVLPAQSWQTGEKRFLSWIVPVLKAGATTHFERARSNQTDAEGVRISTEVEGELDVRVGEELFTTYHFGPGVVRPYLYPVHAAPGIGMTRNWPMMDGVEGETDDHPHHKGIFTAHGEVNGVNNWLDAEGRQIHREFAKRFDGPVDGGFSETLDWTDASGKANMTETRSLKFYAATGGIRLVDYSVTLHASEGRVVLGDTKEGGLLSVRVASSIDAGSPGGGVITNAYGGIQETETWGKPSPWCDYSGPIGDSWYGISLMDHPDNPRYPTPWHVRNYGLMTANCFGYHDFTGNPDNRHELVIESGESRTWNYRILIHYGTSDEANVAGHYLDYAFPPAVEILEGSPPPEA